MLYEKLSEMLHTLYCDSKCFNTLWYMYGCTCSYAPEVIDLGLSACSVNMLLCGCDPYGMNEPQAALVHMVFL